MANPHELKMSPGERDWWEGVRRRGAMWYVVNKGLLFLIAYPLIGVHLIGWAWEPELLVEGWFLGLVAGGFVWMRKELRYRFTLDDDGIVLSDGPDD